MGTSGYAISASAIGQPDLGLISFGELLERARNIVNSVSIPVDVDADTGYGNALNAYWTAKNFIWIEDIIQLVEEVTSHDLCWPTTEPCTEYTLSVESITTALGRKLENHPAIAWFSVLVENLSQGYNTFASLEWQDGNTMAAS